MILGATLERFYVHVGFVCDLMKTRKIARRLGESTKIEDLRERKCCNFPKKTHRKYAQKLKRQMIPKWSQVGCQMEPKWRQKGHPIINVFFDGFPKASGNIDLFATGPRRIRDCSRKCHTFSSRPPGRRHIIKEYYTKTSKDSIACRI